jgi:hypothetical protein
MALAIRRPMPEEAPVTTAVWPFNENNSDKNADIVV